MDASHEAALLAFDGPSKFTDPAVPPATDIGFG